MRKFIESTIEILALAAIVLGTIAFGGVLASGMALIFIPLAFAFFLYLAIQLFPANSQSPSGVSRPKDTAVLIGLLLALGAYCLFQITPLPAILVSAISPQRVAFEAGYRSALGTDLPQWLTLSLDPITAQTGVRLLGMGIIAFILGAWLGQSRVRSHRMMSALIVMVLLEAMYGLWEDLSGRHAILWFDLPGDVACGTFYNRNHFAALLALFVPISLGWTYCNLRPGFARWQRGSHDMRQLNQSLFSRHGLWILVPIILALGVVQSASRGGTASMFLGVALFFALSARSRAASALSWVTAALGIIGFIYAFNSDYEVVLERMGDLLERGHGREIIWVDSWKIHHDFPLIGVGLGNFSKAYTRYSSVDTAVYPYMAHNEWLEGLVTLGKSGMAIVLVTVIVFFVSAFRHLRRSSRDYLWRLGIVCGLIGLGVHCFGEFNLHIPSILITAMLLGGMVVGTKENNKRTEQNAKSDHPKERMQARQVKVVGL